METQFAAVLVQTGVAGVMLGWFMLRQEKQNQEIVKSQQTVAKAIERNTRALMLLRIGQGDTPHSVQVLAKELANEASSALGQATSEA